MNSDLGPYCLQYRVPKNIRRGDKRAVDKSSSLAVKNVMFIWTCLAYDSYITIHCTVHVYTKLY